MLAGRAEVRYAEFGASQGHPLVIVPGLSDGLTHLTSLAASVLPRMYGDFGEFRVIVAQRREPIPKGFTTADMADDLATMLRGMAAAPAHVLGLSMGGFIAQFLAARHPDVVDRLVLGVTAPYASDELRKTLDYWERLAVDGRWREYYLDTLRRTYTGFMPVKYRLAPLYASLLPKAKSLTRYLRQSQACGAHDARSALADISAPTLVIAGREDVVTRATLAEEMADRIGGARLLVLDRAGHGAYEERKADFDGATLAFMTDRPLTVTR